MTTVTVSHQHQQIIHKFNAVENNIETLMMTHGASVYIDEWKTVTISEQIMRS